MKPIEIFFNERADLYKEEGKVMSQLIAYKSTAPVLPAIQRKASLYEKEESALQELSLLKKSGNGKETSASQAFKTAEGSVNDMVHSAAEKRVRGGTLSGTEKNLLDQYNRKSGPTNLYNLLQSPGNRTKHILRNIGKEDKNANLTLHSRMKTITLKMRAGHRLSKEEKSMANSYNRPPKTSNLFNVFQSKANRRKHIDTNYSREKANSNSTNHSLMNGIGRKVVQGERLTPTEKAIASEYNRPAKLTNLYNVFQKKESFNAHVIPNHNQEQRRIRIPYDDLGLHLHNRSGKGQTLDKNEISLLKQHNRRPALSNLYNMFQSEKNKSAHIQKNLDRKFTPTPDPIKDKKKDSPEKAPQNLYAEKKKQLEDQLANVRARIKNLPPLSKEQINQAHDHRKSLSVRYHSEKDPEKRREMAKTIRNINLVLSKEGHSTERKTTKSMAKERGDTQEPEKTLSRSI